MSKDEVVLYDLPTKRTNPSTCWSPNVWKSRMVLNYKNIPYSTCWTEHDQIESTLSAIGIPPNDLTKPGAKSAYTLPAILLPEGRGVMDSVDIAAELEKQYPDPPLHLENGLHEKAAAIMTQLAVPLLPVFFPRIMRNVLPENIVPYWRAKREKAFGCTMEELEAARGGEQAWLAAEPGFEAAEKFLKEHKQDEGPFILGSQVCYGDFILAGMVESMPRIDPEFHEKVIRRVPALRELHEACNQWLKKDT